jgi:hypothetical protein
MGDPGNRCQAATTERVQVLEVRLIGPEGAQQISAQEGLRGAGCVGRGKDPSPGAWRVPKSCLDPAVSSK